MIDVLLQKYGLIFDPITTLPHHYTYQQFSIATKSQHNNRINKYPFPNTYFDECNPQVVCFV